MRQSDLNRAVANATGETISTIKRLGFLISDPDQSFDNPNAEELGGRVIDWDDFEIFLHENQAESADHFAFG